METGKHLRIGVVGLGTVGQGVWKHVTERKADLEQAIGATISLERAVVRDLKRSRGVEIDPERLSTDALAVARDPSIDIVCELIGGTTTALEVTEAALRSGKTVVTANKALLCHHGRRLFQLARRNNAHIYYEASVAGGIPIIKALREGLVVNRFPLIYGILNGTCNYILTRMEREGKSFDEILSDARRLGYVEADESLDLDGVDAAHKTAIITYLAHGKWIPLERMPVEGIRRVSLEDIRLAEKLGFKIKLLSLVLHDAECGRVFASVQPTLVPKEMVLANVDGVFNAISVTGDIVGESVYIGRGAGQDATASAVISDIVDAGRAIVNGISPELPRTANGLTSSRPQDVRRSFYLRLEVKDEPGVLAQVATILSRAQISLESVLQRPGDSAGEARLVGITHLTTEAAMARAAAQLARHPSLTQDPFLLRIADFAQRLG